MSNIGLLGGGVALLAVSVGVSCFGGLPSVVFLGGVGALVGVVTGLETIGVVVSTTGAVSMVALLASVVCVVGVCVLRNCGAWSAGSGVHSCLRLLLAVLVGFWVVGVLGVCVEVSGVVLVWLGAASVIIGFGASTGLLSLLVFLSLLVLVGGTLVL